MKHEYTKDCLTLIFDDDEDTLMDEAGDDMTEAFRLFMESRGITEYTTEDMDEYMKEFMDEYDDANALRKTD